MFSVKYLLSTNTFMICHRRKYRRVSLIWKAFMALFILTELFDETVRKENRIRDGDETPFTFRYDEYSLLPFTLIMTKRQVYSKLLDIEFWKIRRLLTTPFFVIVASILSSSLANDVSRNLYRLKNMINRKCFIFHRITIAMVVSIKTKDISIDMSTIDFFLEGMVGGTYDPETIRSDRYLLSSFWSMPWSYFRWFLWMVTEVDHLWLNTLSDRCHCLYWSRRFLWSESVRRRSNSC